MQMERQGQAGAKIHWRMDRTSQGQFCGQERWPLEWNRKMNESDFYELVKKMRIAQREYFACRCPSSLNRAKKLERQVDEMVREHENSKLPKQAQLI